MTPDRLLKRLASMLKAGASDGQGGVLLLRPDRAENLRDELGFTGLYRLMAAIDKHVGGQVPDSVVRTRFDWRSLMLFAPEAAAEELDAIAQQLFASLGQRTFAYESDEIALTFSLVYARFDQRFTDVDELLLPLVRQLERIDQQGGNELAFVEPGISAQQAMASSDHMLGLLMEALRNDAMRVVFQPLMATSGRETTESYQMLPRLPAGDGKLITAAEFLPYARDAKLLPVLDRWMTVRASRLLHGPMAEKDVRLFINQSEAILAEAERREWLGRYLESKSALAGRLVLEVPLEDAMMHMRGAARLLELAREHQVGICLSHVDEHSRWALLGGELKPDFLRMSPGFVNRLTQRPGMEEQYLELSRPVREQEVRIIMPMIEDPQTAASMWRTGADYMQGNMIQAPEDTIAG